MNLLRTHRLRVLLLGAIISSSLLPLSCESGAKTDTLTFFRWLGEQRADQLKTEGRAVPLSDLEVELKVVKGAALRALLRGSANPTITYDEQKQQLKSYSHRDKLPQLDHQAFYVYASVKYVLKKKGERRFVGEHMLAFNVQVTEGSLKGAVIHFLGTKEPISSKIGSRYQAFYRIPDGIAAREGELKYNVVTSVAFQ